MKIMITGASGFVGTHLCINLLNKGHNVIGAGRSKHHRLEDYTEFSNSDRLLNKNFSKNDSIDLNHRNKFEWISADTTLEGGWQDRVKTCDVIINLTGKSIFGYWTKKYKSEIYKSRISTTKNIVSAMPDNAEKQLLLNTSAIGYYGDRGEKSLIETDSSGDDFLAGVCIDWENAAAKAREKGARVVLMRFGVVIGKNGGAISKMMPAFKFFAGGPLGKGMHWFPWIHIDDLCNAVIFFIENENISGAVNLVSPDILRHREFASELGKALNRPSFMPAPAFMVKAVMGEAGQAFLSSQKAVPSILNNNGFKFKYSNIQSALRDVIVKTGTN